jgi:long-chain acyl-CoA synthetase
MKKIPTDDELAAIRKGLNKEQQRLFDFVEETGCRIMEGYGLTEAGPVTHLNPYHQDRPPGSIGLPFPSTRAKIVDAETGLEDLPAGEVGELVIKGPQVMSGYWQRPEETALVLRDG